MSAVGFDLGNYNSFVALVRSGGIETVDNEYSDRATPTNVSFTDTIRHAGSSAKSQFVTNFRNSVNCFRNLIGVTYDDPIAQEEMKLSPSQFVKLEDGGIGVEVSYLGKKERFSIIQLVGIMLSELKSIAHRHKVVALDCVLNVPSFFSDAQRRAVVDAASISDIKPLALMNDTAAVCLGYGFFRTDLPEEGQQPRNVLFVNVGYSCTQVCIGSFSRKKVKMLASLGTPSIGGRNFDFILCEKFCKEFEKKYKLDVKSNRKAWLRLLCESEALKKKISTNSLELPISIESFMEDKDVTGKSSRDELETLGANIFDKFEELIRLVVAESKLDIGDIDSIEGLGGSFRITGFRSRVNKIFGKEPSTTLNADEVVARGCAVKCAILSPSVRIREYELKEVVRSHIKIAYMSQGGNPVRKEVDVFKIGQSFPSLREVSLPPTSDDFSFELFECDKNGKSITIANYRITQKRDAKINAEKLLLNIRLDHSGICGLVKAFLLENQPIVEEVDKESGGDKATDEVAAKTGENEQQSDIQKVTCEAKAEQKYKKVKHELTVECKPAYDVGVARLNVYREKECSMKQQIKLENIRTSSKNGFEEFIYFIRSKMDGEYSEYITADERSKLDEVLVSEEDWLYEDGSFCVADVYDERLLKLKDVFATFERRHSSHVNTEQQLKDLSGVLVRYRKLLDVYNEHPSMYEHIKEEEYKAFSDQVKAADIFISSVSHSLNTTPKTELIKIGLDEIAKKRKELCGVCDPIIKKGENPTQKDSSKPEPSETQTQDKSREDGAPEAEKPIPMDVD